MAKGRSGFSWIPRKDKFLQKVNWLMPYGAVKLMINIPKNGPFYKEHFFKVEDFPLGRSRAAYLIRYLSALGMTKRYNGNNKRKKEFMLTPIGEQFMFNYMGCLMILQKAYRIRGEETER